MNFNPDMIQQLLGQLNNLDSPLGQIAQSVSASLQQPNSGSADDEELYHDCNSQSHSNTHPQDSNNSNPQVIEVNVVGQDVLDIYHQFTGDIRSFSQAVLAQARNQPPFSNAYLSVCGTDVEKKSGTVNLENALRIRLLKSVNKANDVDPSIVTTIVTPEMTKRYISLILLDIKRKCQQHVDFAILTAEGHFPNLQKLMRQ